MSKKRSKGKKQKRSITHKSVALRKISSAKSPILEHKTRSARKKSGKRRQKTFLHEISPEAKQMIGELFRSKEEKKLREISPKSRKMIKELLDSKEKEEERLSGGGFDMCDWVITALIAVAIVWYVDGASLARAKFDAVMDFFYKSEDKWNTITSKVFSAKDYIKDYLTDLFYNNKIVSHPGYRVNDKIDASLLKSQPLTKYNFTELSGPIKFVREFTFERFNQLLINVPYALGLSSIRSYLYDALKEMIPGCSSSPSPYYKKYRSRSHRRH